MRLRMIIAGGRDFDDYERLNTSCYGIIKTMEESQHGLFESVEIISGRANGADKLGEVFASEHKYLLKMFPADWDNLGKFAGYARNEQMAKYAACVNEPELKDTTVSVLVAFWDGRSRGTKNMINFANMYEFDKILIEQYPVRKE